MYVVDLYNGIFKALANDPSILELLEITEGNALIKAKRIQKRSDPQNIVENLPLIAFYSPGGAKDFNNDQVYGATFVFDIYTNDDIDKAHKISNRVYRLFDKEIPSFSGLETYETDFEDAHQSATDLQNTYCFTIIMTFNITID